MEINGKLEDTMKKSILILAIFMMLFLLLGIPASADSTDGGTSSSDSRTSSSVEVISLSVESYPERTVYGAFEQLDRKGLSLRATLADGSNRIISAEEINVSYSQDACFRVGDDSVTLSYGGKSLSLPVTVNRIAYDLTVLELSSFSVTYNGSYQSYGELLPSIVGLDGIPLIMTAAGGSVNAGQYDISIDFFTESRDYLTPESRVVTMTVKPFEAEIVWEGLSFIYDGKSKAPSAYFTNVSGDKVYLPVSGAATNAGDGYVARVSATDPNYLFSGDSVKFDIKKADYDFSGVVWSLDSFTYDGRKKSISASGLPVGVSITGYSGDRATDAGKYTATASLSWDTKNYNSPPPLTHSWEILPADYDMTGVSFKSGSYVFDGQMHYPVLQGSMPVGADGIGLEYHFSAGAAHVSDGRVSVVISFKTASKNYNLPEDQYSSVWITPLGIEVSWGKSELSYSGKTQAPDAFSDKCAIRVIGGGTNVGSYTAKAETDNTDFTILNDTISFTIVKASNSWATKPSATTCFEGKEIVLTGKSRFGSPVYTFYSDPNGKEEISAPTLPGVYYAVLTVEGTENYYGLTSAVIRVEIEKIVPVSFFAEIKKEGLRAFDRLTAEDIVCGVVNNDGSRVSVDSSLVTVIYQNGNSLRRSDESVFFKYESFMLTVSVEVGYADYDLSGVSWENTSPTYDGNPKTPALTGLPDGVSVIEYIGAGKINAGSYKVGALLDYDRENYNEPKIAECDFRIEKCRVSLPLITAVYNGEGQYPVSDSPLYIAESVTDYVGAGRYTVLVRLTDADNYVFAENSSSTANAVFEILPATVKVRVADTRLRLFEKPTVADYEIISGRLYNGDTLSVSAYTEGKKIYLRSENPNYTLDVEPGDIIRLPYPRLADGLKILLFALIIFVLVILIIKAYQNRARLASAAAVIKCRWHHRNFTVADPREPRPDKPTDLPSFTTERSDEDISPSNGENDGVTEENAADGFTDECDSPEHNEEERISYDIPEIDVDAERADILITDSLAKSLIKREGDIIYTLGNGRGAVNIDVLSDNFRHGDRVDVNILKRMKLIPEDTAYLKVLASGSIDKPLTVYANEFSLCAVKMIALAGGQAIKVSTVKERADGEKE